MKNEQPSLYFLALVDCLDDWIESGYATNTDNFYDLIIEIMVNAPPTLKLELQVSFEKHFGITLPKPAGYDVNHNPVFAVSDVAKMLNVSEQSIKSTVAKCHPIH